MLDHIEKKILKFLIESQDNFVSGSELSEEFECSSRTIRKYIHSLKQELKNSGMELISKQSFGYMIKIKNFSLFQEFMNFHFSNSTQSELETPINSEERQAYIINRILLYEEKLTTEDFMDCMYASKSTIAKDIKSLKKLLHEHHLELKYHKNVLQIVGLEKDKRKLIVKQLISNKYFETINNYIQSNVIMKNMNMQALAEIILDECRNHHIMISDFAINNLMVHIALSIYRLRTGHEIKNMTMYLFADASREYMVATRILKRIGDIFHIDFPKREVDHVVLHIIAKSYNSQVVYEDEIEKLLEKDIISALSSLSVFCKINFAKSANLIESLKLHLKQLLFRLMNRIPMDNPMEQSIKKDYPDSFQYSQFMMKQMPSFKNFCISDSEIAYIAIHLLSAMEMYKNERIIDVLVITDGTNAIRDLLKNRLQNLIARKIRILGMCNLNQLKLYHLDEFDLILSTMNIDNFIFKIPVVKISPFLKEEDIHRVNVCIEKIVDIGGLHPKTEITRLHQIRIINEYFNRENFIQYNCINREDCISILVKHLGSDAGSREFNEVLEEMILYKENLGIGLCENHVAVPHPIKPVGYKMQIVTLLSKSDFQWGDKLCRLVILISPSKFENPNLNFITGLILKLMDNKNLNHLLDAIESFEDFNKLLLEHLD